MVGQNFENRNVYSWIYDKENESATRDRHRRPTRGQKNIINLLLEEIENTQRRVLEGQIDEPQIQRSAERTVTEEMGENRDEYADRLRSF